MIYIYALSDPDTNEIRYIGKSIRPKERLTNQCNEKVNTYRSHWIQSVLARGKKPIQTILEELPDESNWQEREIAWIAYGREKGWPLTNCTDGGDGVINVSGEGKERMFRTWLGRKHKPETLEKISKSSKGRIQSDESRKKRSLSLKGRIIAPDHRKKLSENVRKFTDDMIKDVLSMLEQGYKVKEIAAKYGVHRTTISKIKMGKYP